MSSTRVHYLSGKKRPVFIRTAAGHGTLGSELKPVTGCGIDATKYETTQEPGEVTCGSCRRLPVVKGARR